MLSGATILLQNVRFAQIAINHIHLPQPYGLRQFAANRNNEPQKKFPDVGVTLVRISSNSSSRTLCGGRSLCLAIVIIWLFISFVIRFLTFQTTSNKSPLDNVRKRFNLAYAPLSRDKTLEKVHLVSLEYFI